jgi:hypothetical protein
MVCVDALALQSPETTPSPRPRSTNSMVVDSTSSSSSKQSSSLTLTLKHSRRSALASLFGITTAAATLVVNPTCTIASDDDRVTSKVLLRGTITLRSDVMVPESEESSPSSPAALYITARPDRPDNVPAAILNGTRGKPPPVLVARLPLASLNLNNENVFPLDFVLTAADVTVEGNNGNGGDNDNDDSYWWSRDNLIVSARLDSDGVAATRDPNDLVGRNLLVRQRQSVGGGGSDAGSDEVAVVVELQGRGVAGKFVTGKQANK